jgi:hypothetical protein
MEALIFFAVIIVLFIAVRIIENYLINRDINLWDGE